MERVNHTEVVEWSSFNYLQFDGSTASDLQTTANLLPVELSCTEIIDVIKLSRSNFRNH